MTVTIQLQLSIIYQKKSKNVRTNSGVIIVLNRNRSVRWIQFCMSQFNFNQGKSNKKVIEALFVKRITT